MEFSDIYSWASADFLLKKKKKNSDSKVLVKNVKYIIFEFS